MPLLVALLTCSIGGRTEAESLVDQQQTGAFYSFATDNTVQTFTPTKDNITGFDLYLDTQGTYSFLIRNFSTGDLVTAVGSLSLDPGVQHIDLPAPAPLTPGTKYVIIIHDSTPGAIGDTYVLGMNGNPYAGGAAGFTCAPWTFSFCGTAAYTTESADYDLFFRTYYAPAADGTPPDTTVVSGPASPTNSTSATFTVSGSDDVTPPGSLTFECSLDGGVFAACSSPVTYTGQLQGGHTFQVRATDGAGNVDPTPASWSWTIDLTAPDAIIDSSPYDPTSSTSATFAFHSADPTAALACSLDSSPFTACTSPATYDLLPDGQHSFAVRAIDQAGNQGGATTFSWAVDTQAPNTLIDTAPDAFTNSNTAVFSFSSTEGATFTCQRENGVPASCTSPITYSGLADGEHTFSVTATDAAFNPDPTAASVTWVVDTVAPDTSITAGPADGSSTTATAATFAFAGTDNVTGPTDLTFGCSVDGGPFAPCTSGVSYSNLSRAQHAFRVQATDRAGNPDPTPATRTWTITKLNPVLNWATPSDIAYPAGLSGTQLNASAEVPGSFAYTPAAGTTLNAGSGQILSVLFTPTDSTNYSTASTTVQINVLRGSQTVAVAAGPPATAVYNATFPVAATASSGLPVTIGVSGACAVASGTVTMTSGTGTCTVTFDQAGSANYAAAPQVVQTATAQKASQTITFNPLPNVKLSQSPVTVSATASSGLSVTFTTTTPTVCTAGGANEATITLLATGSCAVVSHQPGNTNYSSAADVARSFTVGNGKADQTITFAALADKAMAQSPVTVSATASSGLTVTFTTTTPAVCTAGGKSGTTVSLVGAGTCTVKADQGGNSGYNPAPSVTQSFAVTKANQTITFAPLADRRLNQSPFTVSATVSSGLAVTFTTTTPAVCTASGKSGATIKLVAVGQCTVKADQSGNATYNPAVSVTQSFNVTP